MESNNTIDNPEEPLEPSSYDDPKSCDAAQEKKPCCNKPDCQLQHTQSNIPLRVLDVTHNEWNSAHTIALISLITAIAIAIFTSVNFTEYKRQFGVINTPSLAIGSIDIPFRAIGKQFIINYNIFSLTKNAVHIYRSRTCFSFDTTKRENIMNEINSMEWRNSDSYVILEFPYKIQKVVSLNLNKEDSANLQYGFTTFLNEFEYYNSIDKCWATYLFAARLKIGPINRIEEVYYNKNFNLPQSDQRPAPIEDN